MICIFITSGMGVQPTIMETILGILEQTMEYVVGTLLNLISQKFSNTVGPKVCQSQIGDIGLLKSKR